MVVNGAPELPAYKLSSKYLPLCSAEQKHSYRLELLDGEIFWVNYPFKILYTVNRFDIFMKSHLNNEHSHDMKTVLISFL